MTETDLDFLGPVDFSQPIVPQIHRKLRNAIIRNYLEPGRRVSEAGVADALKVSRQPVRETFIRLADQGMLDIRPKSGSSVPQISISKVIQIQAIREAVEADIARGAARLMTTRHIDDLFAQLDRQESEEARNPSTFMELDDLFHKTLAQGADLPFAWNVIEVQKAQLDRVRFLALNEIPSSSLKEQHRAIVEAIADHNPDRAEMEMRAHLRNVLRDLPIIARRNSSYFVD
ncbi:GntR family transcriptional regulator [Martelella alba]|uniref:GntR family transcriptional regulator n=1 Tax=Martelella alba TaxID=2590451 RepID=A0A506U5E1_9HYPH|nr:GntR family transcriptional regulator [Martelella alba]TPW28304.1 GntR family transcriptional regulator [Martelella alba]